MLPDVGAQSPGRRLASEDALLQPLAWQTMAEEGVWALLPFPVGLSGG